MYNNINNNPYNNDGDRFFFPFLLGGLAGAGLVGVSRPRPVYVNSPTPYPYPYQRPYYPPYNPYYRPTGGYYNYSSGGYY